LSKRPFENLSVDVESQHQGTVMEKLGERKGELSDMVPDGNGNINVAMYGGINALIQVGKGNIQTRLLGGVKRRLIHCQYG
jgi:predicted membrane GTPase involved in stress response